MRLNNEFRRFYRPLQDDYENITLDGDDAEILAMKSFEAGLRLGLAAVWDRELNMELCKDLVELDVDRPSDV